MPPEQAKRLNAGMVTDPVSNRAYGAMKAYMVPHI
jgi:hypothetical protein